MLGGELALPFYIPRTCSACKSVGFGVFTDLKLDTSRLEAGGRVGVSPGKRD